MSIGSAILVPLLTASLGGMAGEVEVRKVFGPEDPGGAYKHPASITELANGDLYLAFYGGSGEYATDTAVYGSRLAAGPDAWTPPAVIADTPFVSEGNPVVWQEPGGPVWLFYVVRYGATWSTSRIQAKVSRDGARTWSDPTVLAFEPGMMVRGRPVPLSNGDFLLPIYHETGQDTELVGPDSTSLFLRYDARERRWSESGRIRSKNGNIQPAAVALDDERLLAFCRRGGGYGPGTSGHIIRSESRDGGRTWGEGIDSPFPNPNAAVDLLRLKSGRIVLAYNHSMTARDPLALALSTDDGKTFPHRVNVAEGGTRDFAYPYLIQTRDGKVHLVFTSDRRTVVRHAVFDETTLLEAPPLYSNEKDPRAVAEVAAGRLTVANAAWWGFDEDDATDALQAAIASGARKVFVPNVGKHWVVRPITLASDQELVLEEGVVIAARRGAYREPGDSVFHGTDLANVTIRGHGATVRMRKEDYVVGRVLVEQGISNLWFGQYPRGEWRCALKLTACANVSIAGLTLRDSGGDGILLNGGKGPCKKVHIQDVVCDNNYRQGLSVISVDGLRVERCAFKNTWGTPPSAGVDIEPDTADQMVRDVVFRACRFEDNYGNGIEVFLENMKRSSGDVSVLFENCLVSSKYGTGIRVAKVADDGPGGLVEFRDCVVEGTEGHGIKVRDKSAQGARVRFVHCMVRDAARDRGFPGTWAPIVIDRSDPKWGVLGGVEFEHVRVDDRRGRPAVVAEGTDLLRDVRGTITVRNPQGARADLIAKREDVSLVVQPDPVVRHVKVYGGPGRFGGWPANHGAWAWGNEILVGFSAGHHKDLGPERHAIDRERSEEHLLARSLDGGETWTIEDPSKQGALVPVGRALHGVTPPGLEERPWRDCPGGIDFTHPDFALTARMTDVDAGPSRFYYSLDRGRSWQGPFRLPLFGQKGIAARTDYLVNGPHDLSLFLTASKEDGREGRPLCARTTDGGKTWSFVSWIGPEPNGYAIMPSTVRLGPAELLTAIRCREGSRSWLDTYRSLDDGRSWALDGTPVPDTGEGNPASLIRLADGRLCLTYGYRAAPFGIRARLSDDGGRTWGPEYLLRDDGGGRDVGYPRSVQRPDGKVVTIYYFHDTPKGERYVAATIWDPGTK
jgi:predicted neuraminidase